MMTRAGFFGRNIVARGLTIVVGALLLVAATAPPAFAQAQHVRWDIISLTSPPIIATAGGVASAKANDNSTITVTGTGTFVAPAGGGGTSSAATGGGTWTVCNAAGTVCANGAYQVTGLVRWEPAPGTLSPAITDTIDDGQASAGLAVLRVTYNDSERGVLVVSCRVSSATPASVFEGITASKGFVDYWNRQAASFTLFHIQ
jgi:hypothetical protein